jgi:hypothetical protein
MRGRLTFLAVVVAVIGMAMPALAGGTNNTTYVKFSPTTGSNAGVELDSYWMTSPSGVVHEWRTTDSRHFVFKPAGEKFTAPNCDTRLYDEIGNDIGPNPDFISAFSSTIHYSNYNELDGDDGDLADFLEDGVTYYVCMYHWQG